MSSWKDFLRSWPKSTPRRKGRTQPRLQVQPLEDRVTPVAGSFDIPYAVDFNTVVGATDLSGVVNIGSNTGALIDRGAEVVGGGTC